MPCAFVDGMLRGGHRDAIAIDTGDTQITYGNLSTLVYGFAEVLEAMPVGDGDRILVFASNSWEFVVAYLAVISVRAIPVLVPPRISAEELSSLISQTQPALGIETPRLTHSSLVNQNGAHIEVIGVNCLPGLIGEASGRHALTEEPDHVAVLLFTSGSVSEPRLVQVSCTNLKANSAGILSRIQVLESDRAFVGIPLSYCFALSVLHTHLQAGATVYLFDAGFDPKRFGEALATSAATTVALVPPMIAALLGRRALSEEKQPILRVIQQAGGELVPSVQTALFRQLPKIVLYKMYGQTEATARISILPPARLIDKATSVGLPLPDTRIKISDPDERGHGMILASGPGVTNGYWGKNDAATFLPDGWLVTGDEGYVDEDGFLFITGRNDGVIKVGGVRAHAGKVESVLAAMPGVINVAVVAIQLATRPEAIAALVEAQPSPTGEALTADSIRAWCRERLPRQLQPTVVHFGAVPLSLNGKIGRRQAREILIQRTRELEAPDGQHS